MLRHPSRHYIYYLFSKQTMDIATIVQHLGDMRLPVPQKTNELDEFIRSLRHARQNMRFPARFNPLAPDEDTTTFLERWKISGMWQKDPFVGQASDILNEPRMRRMIECLILGPLSVVDIATRVRRRFGLSETAMNPKVVRSFMHYYWDDTALSEEEWKWFAYSWIPGFNDDFLAAVSAPRNPAGAAMAINVADRGGGQSLNPVVMYAAMRDQGFKMFMEHSLHDKPGLTRTQGAMFALQIVMQAEEELSKHRGGSAELLEELHKIETVYDTRKIATVEDLPSVRASLPAQAIMEAEGEVVEKEKEDE